ncbi:hypothetical protein BU23DRAFT_151388 [Bimuria novae-zelandiae CBS 107.79]|uniref:Uncharacterized protein n=1 Tax=Bimuria novae-zelandiae CBS 107.79 TaxID=1447943 RepID=A0A6A5W1J1_9PLEO|nr:hypothetical protein BU23DRAFT_151388 [Bimuria novae-zelandiae CBS 107.79]
MPFLSLRPLELHLGITVLGHWPRTASFSPIFSRVTISFRKDLTARRLGFLQLKPIRKLHAILIESLLLVLMITSSPTSLQPPRRIIMVLVTILTIPSCDAVVAVIGFRAVRDVWARLNWWRGTTTTLL